MKQKLLLFRGDNYIMTNEIWKDIQGYEGLYQVSNLGRVKSVNRILTQGNRQIFKRSIILKPRIEKHGYLRVTLYKNKIPLQLLVHRLVASVFISNPNNLPQVNHKDKNKQNNCIDNLEWCSSLYNLNFSNIIDKLSIAKQRKIICNTTGEIFESIEDACDKYNLHHANIIKCCKRERNMTGGMKWSYFE